MLFYRLRRKRQITGADEKGIYFDINIIDGEEVTGETFKELSNGRGDDYVEQ